jgi:NAD(P)-dependent dehydrogenase (short-subunit alcohol dehydrogenase family)
VPKAAAIDTLPPTPGAALITGAAHRIGRALALGLAEDGWTVALHYHRSAAAAVALAEEIRDRGGQAVTVGANLALEDEVLGLIPPLVDRIGPLGLLLNNASVFERDQAMTATRASWDLHLETNLRAPFVLSQAFAAQLPHGHSGVIINMIDQRVWNLTPDFTSYTISKVGLWGLTQTLALALAPRIRVNGIGPGPTLASQHQTAAQFARQCQSVPLQRAAGLDEMLAAVKFILATPSLTGQMIALDGGQHLCWAPPSNPLEE